MKIILLKFHSAQKITVLKKKSIFFLQFEVKLILASTLA